MGNLFSRIRISSRITVKASGRIRRTGPWEKRVIVVALAVIFALFAGTHVASATTVDDGCMEDIAGFGLNCTANDVQLSGVAIDPGTGEYMLDITDPCDYPGDETTFTATFIIVTTAKERHDIGIYFATDGDPNGDGAVSGICSISTMPYTPDPPWLDLDGTNDPFPGEHTPSGVQDLCGDINKTDHNNLMPAITITALCVDDDGNGFLDLPNCTSWRQSGANDLCLGPLDAFPGSPSKCRCDMAFNVPVPVPPAELDVIKTASPVTMTEPGGSVNYNVTVTNTGVDPGNNVTLDSLIDNIYGDITSVHDDITATTCVVPQTLVAAGAGGSSYSCSFTANVSGNVGDTVNDTVTASGVDDRGNNISGYDDAVVTITDVLPIISVDKTADPDEVDEAGDDVTFNVLVTNNSVSSDPVIITSLTDDIYGDLNGQGNCSVPQTLAGNGGIYSCSFTAFIGGAPGEQTDTVTASGADDEGNDVSASDSALVTITNVPSEITLVKTANPTSVDEPGGDVTFNFTVTNTSTTDTVTINSLTDTIYGDLTSVDGSTCTVPQVLLPGGGLYSCLFTVFVSGDASDEPPSQTNTATASGVDDDGEEVSAFDDAVVNFNNVPPDASLTKTATEVLVTYSVVVCNDSDAEALTLDELNDDIYGDITFVHDDITSTDCEVQQTLEPAGEDGDCYACSFTAKTSTSPTTDTVTGTVNDNDGSASIYPNDSATVTFE